MKKICGFLIVALLLGASVGTVESRQAIEDGVRNIRAKIAQIVEPGRDALVNVNDLSLWFRSDGRSGKSPHTENSGVTFPPASDQVVYQDGAVWGGRVLDGGSQEIRVGGQTFNIGTVPGGILSPGVAEDPLDPSVRIYRVRPDYQTADLQREAAEFFGLEADAVTPADEAAIREQYARDWQEWPWEKGAPFQDLDGDGAYDPAVDIPGFPNADQVAWFVINDLDAGATQALYGSGPIGLEVQVALWAYSGVNGFPELDDAIFKQYRLIYKGTGTGSSDARIEDMYFAQWVDPDVGDYADDRMGSDVELNMGYAYNASSSDSHYEPLGLAPPAVGYAFLGREMSSFSYWAAGLGVNDPEYSEYAGTLQWYNILRGFLPSDDLANPTPYVDPDGNSTFFPLNGRPTVADYLLQGEPLGSALEGCGGNESCEQKLTPSVTIVEPGQTFGGEYTIAFFADAGGGIGWRLLRDGETVLDSQEMTPGSVDVPGDGIAVNLPSSQGMLDWQIPSGDRWWTWVGAGDWGAEGFEGAITGDPNTYWLEATPVERSRTVELRFASVIEAEGEDQYKPLDPNGEHVSWGYRYLRGAGQPAPAPGDLTSTSAPYDWSSYIVNAEGPGLYVFQDRVPIAVSAWDVDSDPPRRLEVGFLENNMPGGLVNGAYGPAWYNTVDNVNSAGPREWLFVFDSEYTDPGQGSNPLLTDYGLLPLSSGDANTPVVPLMWAIFAARRREDRFPQDGDSFLMIPLPDQPYRDGDAFVVDVPQTEAPDGWVDDQLAAGDRRMTVKTGPFSLSLGETQEVAVVLAGGLGEDNLGSVAELKDRVRAAQEYYARSSEGRLDIVPPALAGALPDDGVVGVDPVRLGADGVRMTFDEPIVAGVAPQLTVLADGQEQAWEAVWSAAGDQAVIKPAAGVEVLPGANYQFTLEGISDRAGNAGANAVLTFATQEVLPDSTGILNLAVRDGSAVPGADVDMEVSFSGGAGIAGGELVLTYDPAILTPTDVQVGEEAAGLLLDFAVNTPGRLGMVLAGSAGLTTESGTLVRVSLTVDEQARHGDSSLLELETAVLYGEDTSPFALETSGGTFTALNRVPQAEDDAFEVAEDEIALLDVLANDADPDDDPLTIVEISPPAGGTVEISADSATVAYTPAGDFAGEEDFAYTVRDPSGETATATVTVTVTPVNDPPVTGDDTSTTAEDEAVTVAVLANDADADGDALKVTAVSQPGSGIAAIAGDTSVVYTPNPDFYGEDRFTYTVDDGQNGTATGAVTVTVAPVDDPPAAFSRIAPAEGSILSRQETATFSWSASRDADGEELVYELILTLGDQSFRQQTADTSLTVDLAAVLDLPVEETAVDWSVTASDGQTQTETDTGTLVVESGQPQVVVSAASIDFGDVPVGERRTGALVVENRGGGDLVFELSSEEEAIAASLAELGAFTVPPGGQTEVEVVFAGMLPLTASAPLVIASNDPDQPELSVAISGRVTGQTVWPGDTSRDGVVDGRDVLPIGIYWGVTGAARPLEGAPWEARGVAAWDNPGAAFADADGSGTVDENDILPVAANWRQSRPSQKPAQEVGLTVESLNLEMLRKMMQALDRAAPSAGADQVRALLAGAIERLALPREFALLPNAPNPFNPATAIRFAVPSSVSPARVLLRVFDVTGQEVRTLFAGNAAPGLHQVMWDGVDQAGRPAASGVYFYRLETGAFAQTRRMLLVR